MALVEEIVAVQEELAAWRRDIHAHPEFGFEEARTADFVASKLEQFGVTVHRGMGKTGVVGVLRVGNETASIGLRADMDALPIVEQNDFAHRSANEGCMHACGHDGHMAMLLGAARYLSRTRNFRGQVNFIFQPAEEGIGGARAMIDDGLFHDFPCDRLFGMHNAPGMPVGQFGATAGTVTAAGAFFDIEIAGTGAHGAFPHESVDPVMIAAELALSLQTVVSRNVRPTDTAVVSVTQVRSGDAYNVIPASARLSGTVRTLSIKVMELIERRLMELAQGIARAHGGVASVDFRTVFHPVVNDAEAASVAADVCDELVGEANVHRDLPAGTGSEDFSFMLEEVPGCYLLLGNGNTSRPVHNPSYDFNDDALAYGASFFASVVECELPTD
ncbi:MAG: M20 aminoacylase family protein [Pseudomonadales bacterium]|jgi:hippurate hydrolase|nr:M20 aminoacylase family protein [Pseudomonadales bacterium]MDP6469681.1 M20 aminoacylase family protein [Pseudomonadales bacterium]MDP6828922.1 M20 aminoacylase family protein [Pseudomonadales bacterium]MDP6972722.1 M20 aminoacylase family protein [Pseudomonadales bacterium]